MTAKEKSILKNALNAQAAAKILLDELTYLRMELEKPISTAAQKSAKQHYDFSLMWNKQQISNEKMRNTIAAKEELKRRNKL